MAIKVKLTWREVAIAATVGVARQCEALKKGLPDKHGLDPEKGWSVQIEGACGELAFAKAINVYWEPTVNTFRSLPDVGGVFEVKTRSKDHYDLMVRDDDHDDRIFILVTGKAPWYTVHGFLEGRQAKRPEWTQTYGNRDPAFFAPQKAIRRIEDLVRILKGGGI